MDSVVFYDAYAPIVNTSIPEGILRLRNDLYSAKISEETLAQLGCNLSIEVTNSARCDNYDRIGNVFFAFVKKGSASYHPDSVVRIEAGRYITPFMNKNILPTSVNYLFQIDHLSDILTNPKLLKIYDVWLELSVFGVPYAAQKEVTGCSDRNDTFEGHVQFITSGKAKKQNHPVLLPLTTYSLLNNYEVNATDTLGKTTKTFSFELPIDLARAKFVVITSNHGANEGGEEYIRREHLISLDDSLLLSYTPGGKSCEEFRKFNTQANGIYGSNPESDSSWASWNNWCPGNVIPTREIEVNALKKGKHTIQIRVPEAQFVDASGYFPISIYLIGDGKFKTILIPPTN
jgi:hypothetical protein